MPNLDALAPNYRRARDRWPDAPTLVRGYDGLDVCFSGNGHGQVELVKSFIESVCLTIMGELRAPMPSAQPSTTELLVAALSPLGLRNARGATKLDKVLSGFNRLADALGEMRNETGSVAHGRDGFLELISADHARAFLHAGDAILGVLLNAFEGKQPDLISTREPYENFPHLNERIDRAVVVEARIDDDGDRPMVVFSVATGPRGEAIELRVEPSRLLYGIDREAYVEVLETAALAMEEDGTRQPEAVAEADRSAGITDPAINTPEGPISEVTGTYAGNLNALRPGVEAFMVAESLNPVAADMRGGRLIDSLLATAEQNMGLDWKRRDAIQARLKVACKRVLIRFGGAPDKADSAADRFVSWLHVQAPETDSVI